MAEIWINGIAYTAQTGSMLGDILARSWRGDSTAGSGQPFGMPCGGHGRCGKCKVAAKGSLSPLSEAEKRLLSRHEIEEGIRLACCTAIEGDCSARIVLHDGGQTCTDVEMPDFPLNPAFGSYGFALDVGTTTLAARLYDTHGKLLAKGSRLNPQTSWGADVVSRMEADLKGQGEKLSWAVRAAVGNMAEELSAKAGISPGDIDAVAVTGNTVMLHLLTGTSTEPLSHAPFAPRRLFGETVAAAELGLASLQPAAAVYLAPCAAAFVGADLVTAVAASGICKTDATQLLADIGTNGEMALWHKGGLYCCSTAAGPAFEGAGISMGMGGGKGAVDRVTLRNGSLAAHVIGDAAPKGICGSGVVDAAACLLESGRMDETGYLGEGDAVICGPVILTQNDIRMVQLAKSAIHAGIRTLLHAAGVDCGEVSALLVAGGFGSFLDTDNAVKIGLIPAEMRHCIRAIGNAALSGASMLLLNGDFRRICERSAGSIKLIELASDPFFADEYINRMSF